MVRIVKTIGTYDVHFEPEEVDSLEKITKLIDSGKIGTPGLLINAIITVQNAKGVVKSGKQAEALEEKLLKEFNKLKVAYYKEFKLMERDDVDWKEVMKDLLYITTEDLFAKYL